MLYSLGDRHGLKRPHAQIPNDNAAHSARRSIQLHGRVRQNPQRSHRLMRRYIQLFAYCFTVVFRVDLAKLGQCHLEYILGMQPENDLVLGNERGI